MTEGAPRVATTAARALLGAVVVAGSAFLWIGIPALGLWVAGQLTTTSEGFLFAALGGIPLSMVVTGWLLYRVAAVYESLGDPAGRQPAGRAAWLRSHTDERGSVRQARQPRPLVDVAMTASAVAALIALVIWFFFFAGSPLGPMG